MQPLKKFSMQTTTSNELERPFASTTRTHSTVPHYTVKASSQYGTCDHTFVDLDSALFKMRELAVLGIPEMSIYRIPPNPCVSSAEPKHPE